MRLVWRGAMLLIGLLVAVGLGEVILRASYEPPVAQGVPFFLNENRQEFDPGQAEQLGYMIPVEPAPPRRLMRPAPNATLYLCYRDYPQPWFDEYGCVKIEINSRGLREREEIGFEKPEGQTRIVCIGDSFTFGWGVNIEDCWVPLVEKALRPTLGDVVTVNCGGAGASLVEEYWWGLRDRFHKYDPDVVLVALCLNDLFLSNDPLAHKPEEINTGSLFLDQTLFHLRGGDFLRLDPDVDWVDELLHMPDNHPLYARGPEQPSWYWGSGGPQQALLEMRNWCRERGVSFGVVLWPFVQGMGTDFYPFEDMHSLVAAFCDEQEIDFLDLLPAMRNEQQQDLWVTPSDLHISPLGHTLAVEPIASFAKNMILNAP